jgi:riboflavin biosynthesis pyrimidine reductase
VEAVSYRQLVPDQGETDARSYIDALTLPRDDATGGRPYTLANFVASVDGHATFDGKSRKLSDPGDRDLFRSLRERADAVLVGTGTLAAEHYGRMLPAEERRQRRIADGRPAEPLVVTVTRADHLPLDIPLFDEPNANVVVFSPTAPDTRGFNADVRHEPLVDLSHVFETLRRDYEIELLLCEGGPELFGALVHERLVDELFLTLAPRLVGESSGPGVASGPPLEVPAELKLASALERDGTLFLRYRF